MKKIHLLGRKSEFGNNLSMCKVGQVRKKTIEKKLGLKSVIYREQSEVFYKILHV